MNFFVIWELCFVRGLSLSLSLSLSLNDMDVAPQFLKK
jgi:hypothetical protein